MSAAAILYVLDLDDEPMMQLYTNLPTELVQQIESYIATFGCFHDDCDLAYDLHDYPSVLIKDMSECSSDCMIINAVTRWMWGTSPPSSP